MKNNFISWVIRKKFQDETGALVYKGISLTKVGIVILALLKSLETGSAVLFDQSFIGAPIVIPNYIYEMVATFTGIAARESIVTKEISKN